jgi:CDP-glycerol glycerophosphotransferase
MKYKIKLIIKTLFSIFVFVLAYINNFIRKNNEDIWLISERGDDANDNGYVFFKYIKETHPDVNVKYVIHKNSDQLNKVSEIGDVVYTNTFNHYMEVLNAKYLISTHISGYLPTGLRLLHQKKLLRLKNKKIIFLQHGVIKDYHPNLIKDNTDLDLFICGAQPEYNYVLEHFGHGPKVVKYTGLARFDNLHQSRKENQILFMPTWRFNLINLNEREFKNTDYYKSIYNVLNHSRLKEILNEFNTELIFLPHYEIRKYFNDNKWYSGRIIVEKDISNIQKHIKDSALLITDFSSVFFDFAYMRKPVLYYHFDYDDFRKNHYKKGYFDYINMGFGPIAKDPVQLISNLYESLISQYRIDKQYIIRMEKFFPLYDTRNSERIYNEISHL